MLFLASTKKLLTIVGIRPIPTANLPSILKNHRMVINRAHIALVVAFLVTYNISITFFLLFEAATFTQVSESVMFYLVSYLHLSFYSISIWKQSQIVNYMDDFERIVQERCQHATSKVIYQKANRISELFAKFIWNCMFLFVELFTLPSAIFSCYKFFVLNAADDSFNLVLPTVFPWNWHSPTGYLAAFCAQSIWLHCVIMLIICTISLFVKLFTMLGAFATDICEKMEQFDTNFDELTRNHQFTSAKRFLLKEKLVEIIQFHATTRKFVDQFSDIYSALLTVYFGLLTVILCTTLLGLNAAVGIIDFVRLFICVLITLNYVFMLCIFGDETTTKFDEIHKSIGQSRWNECPLEMQKLFPLMLRVALDPVYLKGYMSVRCTREFMKAVCSNAFQFFMVLRGFNR